VAALCSVPDKEIEKSPALARGFSFGTPHLRTRRSNRVRNRPEPAAAAFVVGAIAASKGCAMFKSDQNDYGEDQATNLALVGLLFLFAFVVLFIFIGMNADMTSDAPASTTTRQNSRL